MQNSNVESVDINRVVLNLILEYFKPYEIPNERASIFTQIKIIMKDNIVYFMINLLVLFAIEEKYIIMRMIKN